METLEKIGSAEFAEAVLSMNDYESSDGWEYLSQGSFRETFRGPDGLVYKKNLNNYASFGYNRMEYETFTKLKERGVLWVPQFSFYQISSTDEVMVVQYLRDSSYQDWRNANNKERYEEISMQVIDSGDDNTGVDPETGLVFIRDGGNGLFSY